MNSKFFFDILTSFTDDEWTFWEAQSSLGILASKMWRFPTSVTYAIWDALLGFQQALSTTYLATVLCKILSVGNLESKIAILSSEALNITETSAEFH